MIGAVVRVLVILSLSTVGMLLLPIRDARSVADRVSPINDASWITIGGEVTAYDENHFELRYAGGTLTVKLDGWPGRVVRGLRGRVLVYAHLDDDFYNLRSISASSIFIANTATQVYPSGRQETDFVPTVPLELPARVALVGTVNCVSGWNFEFETSAGPIEVDTRALPRMRRQELQSLSAGDRLRVSGALSAAVFGRTLKADVITHLQAHASDVLGG